MTAAVPPPVEQLPWLKRQQVAAELPGEPPAAKRLPPFPVDTGLPWQRRPAVPAAQPDAAVTPSRWNRGAGGVTAAEQLSWRRVLRPVPADAPGEARPLVWNPGTVPVVPPAVDSLPWLARTRGEAPWRDVLLGRGTGGWLYSVQVPAPPVVVIPVRKLSLAGRVETALALAGHDETALLLTGRVEIALSLVGSLDVSSLLQPLGCVYGEAVEITLTMDEAPASGVSGWTLGFWLKKDQGSDPPAVIVTKTSGSGITLVDAVNGVWTIDLSSTNTKQAVGSYYFDVWRTDAGDETALAQGRLLIGNTTRP
jgi:hypothetical protein